MTNKQEIKNILRESINLDFKEKKQGYNLFNLIKNNQKVGFVVVGQINKNLNKDTLEIINIQLDREESIIEQGIDTVKALFLRFPEINRLIMRPEQNSKDFWFKIGASEINHTYMTIIRGI